MESENQPAILRRPDGTAIAYHRSGGQGPGIMFCPGLMSDMGGTKATALERHCAQAGRACVRFDYRGHGRSSGRFVEATIGDWLDDATAVLDEVADGPQVVVGSSLGGWIALLLARARPDRVAGLVLVAPAVDFVTRMWAGFSDEIRETLRREGVYRRPSEYSEEPYQISLKLLEEGRRHLLMQAPIALACPVRILHGMEDPDVPWQGSLDLVERLQARDVTLTLIKHGDHRLSSPQDIERLLRTTETLAGSLAEPGPADRAQ